MSARRAVTDLAAQADTLRRLHHGPEPLLLPNVWDVATARAVADTGFPVIATSSRAIADSLGFPDTDAMPVEVVFAAVSRISAAVDVPVTADLEAGYGLPAAVLVQRLIDAGAVGCNLEDTDHHGPDALVPVEAQMEWLRAVREASTTAQVAIVINARTDVFLHASGSPESKLSEALRRGRAYIEAGADCVYPIGLIDADAIGTFVRELKAPVNIWLRPDRCPIETLTRLGVARISLASGLFRLAMAEVQRTLDALRADERSLDL